MSSPPQDPQVTRMDLAAARILAARILARTHRPDWRPANDAELDAWAAGFNAGWTQGYAAARAND